MPMQRIPVDNPTQPTPAGQAAPPDVAAPPQAAAQAIPPQGAPQTAPQATQASQQILQATARQLTAPAALQTAGVALGIGLAAALVINLLSAIILTASLSSAGSSALSDLGGTGVSLDDMLGSLSGSVSGPNFFQMLIFMMAVGVGGTFTLDASAGGLSLGSVLDVSFTFPVTLSGLALCAGAAFGAYMFARKNAIRFKWLGVASAVATGLATGLVYVIISAIFPLSMSASLLGSSMKASLSGATFRTFFMAFLLATLGALAGYALAQYAPDSSNVFLAAWTWMHRARGFARTLAEATLMYSAVFTALAVITLLASAISNGSDVLVLLPFAFPLLPIMLFAISSFGSIAFSTSDQQASYVWAFGDTFAGKQWLSVILVLIFLAATLYIALRAAARNMYDRHYADWKHSWKFPVATSVIWLIFTYLVAGFSLSASSSATVSLAPAAWCFLIAGAWAFAIEAVALTFGPSLVTSLASLWRIFAGGTVQMTPRNVIDYVAACEQKTTAQDAAMVGDTATAGDTAMTGDAAMTDDAAMAVPPADGVAAAETTTPPAASPAIPDSPAAPATSAAPITQTTPIAPPNPTAPTPPVAQPRKPMSAKQKGILIAVGVVIVLAVAAGIAYKALNATVFNPQHIAESYLTAIDEGKYSEANRIADPQVSTKQQALLVDKVGAAENATISNARIVSIDDATDGSKTVNVTYTIGGDTVNDTFTIARTGTQYLLFPQWSITTPMLKELSVSGSSIITSVNINGVDVTADNATNADYEMMFKVYPGTYTITASESKYYASDTVTANTYDGGYAYLEAEETSALTEELQSAIDSKLQECVASTATEPDGCPFGMYAYNEERYRNVKWTLVQAPTIDYVYLESGMFSTDYDGEVDVTYEYQGWDDEWEARDDSDTFSMSGSFVIDGDSLTVSIDEY